jgi:hypothetical protein
VKNISVLRVLVFGCLVVLPNTAAAQAIAPTKEQLVGSWRTQNADQMYDEENPSLTYNFYPDGTFIADKSTVREYSGSWRIDAGGPSIITTIVTNDNFQLWDRIVDFDPSIGSLVISSEAHNGITFYLRQAGFEPNQTKEPFRVLANEQRSITDSTNFNVIVYCWLSALPDKVVSYQIMAEGGSPEIYQIIVYDEPEEAELVAKARRPKDLEELKLALYGSDEYTFPSHNDNVGVTDIERARVFFDEYKTAGPKFKEWASKAKELKPDAFTKNILKQKGESGYAFEFEWDNSQTPKLLFYAGFNPLGDIGGKTTLTEQNALNLDSTLEFREKAIEQATLLVDERITATKNQKQIIEDSFQ